MLGLVPSCESKKAGEGEKTILGWFTKEPSPNPFSPRVRYLFEHADRKKINALLTRKDITGKEMNKLLEEELDACAPPTTDFSNLVRADMDEGEDMDEDKEGSGEVEEDGEMGKMLGEITGEGEKTTLGWFTKEPSPNPFSPCVRYLFEHVDRSKINAILTRKDITGKEMNKLLKEELDACAPPTTDFGNLVRADVDEGEDMDEDEEEDMDEDKEDEGRDEVEAEGEMRKTLGDQENHGIMKRPQESLVQSELESKKPRLAEGFGFLGGEPVAAEL